jgi:cell pole-organizing protein PopZ
MTTTQPPADTPSGDAPDPSMEEILASIRRILNEEEQPAALELPPEASSEEDVLVLDQSMLVSPPEPEPEQLDPMPEPAPAPAPSAATAPVPRPRPEPEAAAESPPPAIFAAPALAPELVAPEAAAAAASSVGSLMRTLAAGRATQVWSGGPTLEDMVRAELRPLLKDWLDSNLPPLVERLVRAEIERVVNRAVP